MSDLTPVQRIEAAIQRLETLRDASTPGPWRAAASGFGEWVEAFSGDDDSFVAGGTGNNTELIVTLHRTIDAQLAILYCCLRMDGKIGLRFNPLDHTTLALADAINVDLGTVQAVSL